VSRLKEVALAFKELPGSGGETSNSFFELMKTSPGILGQNSS
jgi:hypothetical protein